MPTPLSYREALDLYQNVPRKESLSEWAEKMNKLTGTDRYAAATQDPLGIKRASATIDQLLEKTGLPAASEELGRGVGELVGDPEAGARVGKALPRTALNFAPLLIPGGGVPGAIAKFGGTALLTGAETYTATGSPTAGLISGATAIAMPPAAAITERLVGQYALKKLGGRLVEGKVANKAGDILMHAKEYFPQTLGQRVKAGVAAFTAGQVAASGVGQVGMTTQELATGQPITSPFTTENLLNQTLGQVPFAAIHGARTYLGKPKKTPMQQADLLQHAIDTSEPYIVARVARDAQRKQPDVSKLPEVKQPDEIPPSVVAETQAVLAKIRGEQLDVKNDPNLSEAQRLEKMNSLLQLEAETLRKKQAVPQSVFGNIITKEQPRQELIGRQVYVNKTGTFRRILVVEDPLNPPELWNQVLGYSTLHEPVPVFGLQTLEGGIGRFSLPDRQWQTAPKPAYSYFERRNTPAKRATAEQVVAERAAFPAGIDPTVKPLVDALNGKNVFTTGSDERTVKVANAYVDESKLPPNWSYDPESGAISKSVTVTDPSGLRPEEIQPIVNAVTPQPRPKITVGRPEGQPDLPIRETPMSDEELGSQLHEIEKITLAAAAAETPLDAQRAVVELNAIEGDNDLPATDDTTLRRTMEQIEATEQLDPNQAPKAAVIVEAKKTARKLRAKQRALAELEAEAPVTLEQDPNAPTRQEIAEVAELLGAAEGNVGFSVRDASHLSHVSEDPIMTDMVAEAAFDAVSKGTDAVKAFKKWSGREDTTIEKDAKDFYDIIGQFNPTKLPYDEVADFLNARSGTSTWDEFEVRGFMIRPHVQLWLKGLDQNIGKIKELNAEHVATEIVPESPGGIPAGGGFIFGVKPIEQIQGMTKTGVIPETKFQNVGSFAGAFSKEEMTFMKTLVPEAFAEGNVDVRTLQEGLRQRGPVIETRTLTEQKVEQVQQRQGELQHQIETLGYEVETSYDPDETYIRRRGTDPMDIIEFDTPEYQQIPENVRAMFEEYGQNRYRMSEEPESLGVARYSFVAPKPEDQMPGYVVELVRLPTRPGEVGAQVGRSRTGAGRHYRGEHFGAEDIDVLSFYRGYEETSPSGEKAFHVIEIQSPWGQEHRENVKAWRRSREEMQKLVDKGAEITYHPESAPDHYIKIEGGGWFAKSMEKYFEGATKLTKEIADRLTYQEPKYAELPHPLLAGYNELALKAAIQHARSVGATKLILSDAETVGMTEGHDNVIQQAIKLSKEPQYNLEQAEQKARSIDVGGAKWHIEEVYPGREWKIVYDKLPFVEGNKQHYDKMLPSAAEKLTKSKGEEVDLGVHKNTQRPAASQLDVDRGEAPQTDVGRWITEGSPYYKNPDGTPKTNITGRAYDLGQVPGEFTIMGRAREPGVKKVAPRWERETAYVPETPGERYVATQLGLDEKGAGNGHGLINFLVNHADPFYRALGVDLRRLAPETLSRVLVQTKNGDSSYVMSIGGGRTEISLASRTLNSSSDYQGYVAAHELIHGLTVSELNNPLKANVVTQLDQLRTRLIDQLPTRLQKYRIELMQQDWYGRYSRGEVTGDMSKALGLTAKNKLTTAEQSILYGLMTTKEMVSQGITVKEFRNYMQGIKVQKQSVFTRFANTVKVLLGIGEKISGTEFEQFLAHTDVLLQQGDYVSSFNNFANRYFERLGQTADQVVNNTKRALGLISDTIFGTSPSGLLTQIRFGGIGRSPEIEKTGRELTRMYQERGDDFATTASILDEHGYPPEMKTIDNLADDMMLGEVPKHGDMLDTLPPAVTNYIFARARDAKQILGSIQQATREANKGVLNIIDPKAISGPVNTTIKMLDNILGFEKEHQDAQQVVDGLEGVPPSGHITNLVQNPEILPEWVVGADKTKSKENWLHYTFEPIAQWARRIPEVAEVVSKGWQLDANARKMSSEGLKPFGTDLTTMELSRESVKNVESVLENPKLTKAIDQWLWENQRTGKPTNSVTMLDSDHPEIKKILAPLSTKERDQVEDLVQKHQMSQQQTQAQILEKMLQIASTQGSAFYTGPVREGVKRATILMDALRADRNDPVAARAADAKIDMVQKSMQPEEFLNLLKYSQGQVERWTAYKDFYQRNPAWSSAQRYGKFLVTYMRGKKVFLAGVDSKKEADRLTQGAKVVKFEKNQRSEADTPPNLGPDSVGMITRLRELDQNMYDMLLNTGKYTQEDIANMKRWSGTEQLATEEAYRGGVPGMTPPPRGLTKGASELPWLRNHFSWVKKTSTYWSRQLLRAQVHAHLLDPEIAQNRELQAKLQTHFNNMLTPDTPVGHFFQRAAMNWFMGFNPASALINATQPFLTHTAEFTAMTGKPVDSYRRTIGALKDITNYYRKGKKWDDPDLEWAMHKSAQDGEIDLAMYDDRAAEQESVATNYKRIMDGQRTMTTGQRLATKAGSWSTAAMWMFRGVERQNTMAALISSFKYYKEQGYNREIALEKAYEFNHAVNFGGGRAQRPVGLFAGRGVVPRTAAMLATSMQSYVLGTTFQLARYIQRGYFRPEGLTPGEVYGARKAAVQMLSVQLASAGVLGLPFVSGAIAALNALFPDLEVRRHLQEWMDELLGNDKENGSILSDAAMMGVPSMFGWDLQSRLSMGNTVPGVSEVNGFDPELLLGAPVNMVYNFVKGGQQLTQGDVSAIDKFVPPALRKIEQYARQGGLATDYRDRPIFTPTKGEVAGMALGFQPKRLTDFNTASRIAKQSQDNITRRKSEFYQQMGEQVLKGNFGNVRAELLKRTREDERFDAASAARSIAQAAEALTFPRDLRREGTVAAGDVRARLLKSFNIPPSQPDEMNRLRFRQGVEQRLGLPVSTGNDLLLAQVMDQLRRRSPEASRSDLRRQAERLLRGPRPQTIALPQE